MALAALPFAADAKGFADYHTETLKLPCTTCHKTPDTMPTTETCTGCHPTDKLVESTKNVKPTNPHTSPHYGAKLDCVNCHVGHEPSALPPAARAGGKLLRSVPQLRLQGALTFRRRSLIKSPDAPDDAPGLSFPGKCRTAGVMNPAPKAFRNSCVSAAKMRPGRRPSLDRSP